MALLASYLALIQPLNRAHPAYSLTPSPSFFCSHMALLPTYPDLTNLWAGLIQLASFPPH